MSFTSTHSSNPSLASKTGMKWLEILEREFDTAFVDLDVCLGQLDEDSQDIAFDARSKMTALSSAFAQLAHKASLVFDANSRYETTITSLREKLAEEKANVTALTEQLKIAEDTAKDNPPLTFESRRASTLHTLSPTKKKSSASTHGNLSPDILKQIASSKYEIELLRKENTFLRNQMLVIQGDLFGARLAAKYLDKELAGRIQQIQLLAKSDLRGIEHDRLWNQLEAEIHLHRHKTVVRACRTRSQFEETRFPPPIPSGLKRQIEVQKSPDEGLGISITGGKEHGIPIIISEIHPGSAAKKAACLYVGDAILSVNGTDLKDLKHNDAAQVLTSQTGNCTLEVMYLSPDESFNHTDGNSNSDSKDNEIKYHFFDPDIMGPEVIAALQDNQYKKFSEVDQNDGQDALIARNGGRFMSHRDIYPGAARLCLNEEVTSSHSPQPTALPTDTVNHDNTSINDSSSTNGHPCSRVTVERDTASPNSLVNNHWKVPQGVSYSKKETTID